MLCVCDFLPFAYMAKITLIEELETQTPRVSKVDGFQQLNI